MTTIDALKAAVHLYQMNLLKFAWSRPILQTSVTAGLGTLQHEDTDQRRKTMRQIQELQSQLAPSADNKVSEPVAMDIDAIVRDEENEEEEDSEESATKEPEDLFFMEPDHKEVRTNEDPDTQDYWEAGLTTESLSTLKTGNVDNSQKLCYHFGCKGHIKANCPERRKLGARPWTKRSGPRVKKTVVKKGYGTGGGVDKDLHVKAHPRGRGTMESKQRKYELSNS